MGHRVADETEVLEFVARKLAVRRDKLSVSTTLLGDLGVAGDDGEQFMKQFSDQFHVDLSQLDSLRHFGPEQAIWPWQIPGVLFWTLAGLFGFRFSRRSAEERAGLVPITIGDLVRAARAGHW
jgi:hypothetical protein